MEDDLKILKVEYLSIHWFDLLPHSAYLGISAKLKICQVSACKIRHDVALYSEGTNQPTNQPANQPGPLSFKPKFLSTHSYYRASQKKKAKKEKWHGLFY
jgi:hypothetical protein